MSFPALAAGHVLAPQPASRCVLACISCPSITCTHLVIRPPSSPIHLRGVVPRCRPLWSHQALVSVRSLRARSLWTCLLGPRLLCPLQSLPLVWPVWSPWTSSTLQASVARPVRAWLSVHAPFCTPVAACQFGMPLPKAGLFGATMMCYLRLVAAARTLRAFIRLLRANATLMALLLHVRLPATLSPLLRALRPASSTLCLP